MCLLSVFGEPVSLRAHGEGGQFSAPLPKEHFMSSKTLPPMLLFTDRKQFEVLGSQLWFAFDQRICGPSSPAIFNALSHM